MLDETRVTCSHHVGTHLYATTLVYLIQSLPTNFAQLLVPRPVIKCKASCSYALVLPVTTPPSAPICLCMVPAAGVQMCCEWLAGCSASIP